MDYMYTKNKAYARADLQLWVPGRERKLCTCRKDGSIYLRPYLYSQLIPLYSNSPLPSNAMLLCMGCLLNWKKFSSGETAGTVAGGKLCGAMQGS